MTGPSLKFLREEGADPNVPLPRYETEGAAGADIRANLPASHREKGMILHPGQRVLVSTGLRAAVPAGFELQVRPRSGLALKQGLTLVNTPGTIDSDYRGPLGIIVINHGQETVTIGHGDRIAQIVLAPVVQAQIEEVDALDETVRGAGGFGSTGRS